MTVRKRTIRALSALGGLLLLLACKPAEPLRGGIVTNTHFYPAHDVQVDDGSITVGDMTIPMSHTEHVPDKWDLRICDEDQTAVYSISKEEFEKIKIGQYWNFFERGAP